MRSKPRTYFVYVIESTVRGRRIFYVGQTNLSPQDRFRQHKGCSSFCTSCTCRHYVKGEALKLRYDLFSTYNPCRSRPEAEEIERWLARKLRARGYEVAGGH
jgi:hypothetical protein